jgi:hypothetical protein
MNQVGSCVVQLRLVASLLVTYRLLVCVLRWMETAKERSSGALAGSTYFGVQYQCAPIQHPPVYVHRERDSDRGWYGTAPSSAPPRYALQLHAWLHLSRGVMVQSTKPSFQ